MAGVFFVVCIPTSSYEHHLLFGTPHHVPIPSDNKVKLDVELRGKNSVRNNRKVEHKIGVKPNNVSDEHICMEKILTELLVKLQIEHVVWCGDKNGNYYEVFFPVPTGESCENCLHCLTELGIGIKLNSLVSVLPCNVTYSGLKDKKNQDEQFSTEEKSQWNEFVDSVKSKLTVKQVVDGVQTGGNLTFDYIMLILTADCLAALGLVENNAPNIVAAMLVSPLMGPVMSLTFGSTISNRQLQCVGLKSLVIGMLLSILFGFIFGLFIGATEMPWGYGDWPTEEMKARGNYRCLWIGVLWALPSGTGVALALLQGSAGPLIGVAISASLLPPVVNCGLFWALSCIWLANDGINIPHIKGESYATNSSSYTAIYTDYMPVEFFINGVISALLTVVNVIFIFISAVIMLKIKEVAAPYTSTPDVRRFWERDIRIVRESNRSFNRSSKINKHMNNFAQEMTAPSEMLDSVLDAAVQEAKEDNTLNQIKRRSYANPSTDELRMSSLHDLNSLERQIATLLATLQNSSSPAASRFHSLSRSHRPGSVRSRLSTTYALPIIHERTKERPDVKRTISLDSHVVNTNNLKGINLSASTNHIVGGWGDNEKLISK